MRILIVLVTLAIMLAPAACSGEPTTPALPTPSGGPVLVVFRRGSEVSMTAVISATERVDFEGAIAQTAAPELEAIGVLAITVPDDANAGEFTRALIAHPDIDRVEPDAPIGLIEPIYAVSEPKLTLDPMVGQQYHHALTGSPIAWGRGVLGSGATVAIIDTGIDCAHVDLRCGPGKDFVNAEPPDDDHGHGTHVAGIVAANGFNGQLGAGISAGPATVIPVKVLSGAGYGSTSAIAAAVIWSADQHHDVMNMSLGGPQASVTFERAVEYADLKGTAVVCAAGNENTNARTYPASYPGCIGVAATDSRDQPASFSNYGPNAEVAFPGVSILSTCRGGGMCTMSGTSMASPGYAGSIALFMARGLTKDEALSKLVTTGVKLGAGKLSGLTRPDLDRASAGASEPTLAPSPTGVNAPTQTPFPGPSATLPPPYPGPSPTGQPPVPTPVVPVGCRVTSITADAVTITCPR